MFEVISRAQTDSLVKGSNIPIKIKGHSPNFVVKYLDFNGIDWIQQFFVVFL